MGGYTQETQEAMTFAQNMSGIGKRTFLINGVETVIDLKSGGWSSKRWDYVNDFSYTDKSSGTAVTVIVTPEQQKAVYNTLRSEFDAATPRQKALADFINA